MKRLAALLLVMCLALAVACGKKGPPVPKDEQNLFAWKAAKGELYTGQQNGVPVRCLSVTADMTGASRNVQSFLLEVEPQTADVCTGCPFLPGEIAKISPQTIQTSGDTTRFSFEYCPKTETATYRWRLVARSLFTSAPHMFSKVYTTPAAQ